MQGSDTRTRGSWLAGFGTARGAGPPLTPDDRWVAGHSFKKLEHEAALPDPRHRTRVTSCGSRVSCDRTAVPRRSSSLGHARRVGRPPPERRRRRPRSEALSPPTRGSEPTFPLLRPARPCVAGSNRLGYLFNTHRLSTANRRPNVVPVAIATRSENASRAKRASPHATCPVEAMVRVRVRIAERLVAGTVHEATSGDRAERFHGDRSQPAAGRA